MTPTEQWNQNLFHLGTLIFGFVLLAIIHTVATRILGVALTFLLSYVWNVPKRFLLILVQGFLFKGLREVSSFVQSVYNLAGGDGAHNEEIGGLVLNGAGILCYCWTSLVLHNIGTTWWLFRQVFSYILYTLGSFSAATILWFWTVDNPWQTLFTEVGPIIGWIWRRSLLPLIRLTLLTCITVYNYCLKCAAWSGLFDDDQPRLHSLPEYQYSSLEGTEHIRLLEIRRKYPFGPILCRLLHVSLEDASTYEAISYTWGNPAKAGVINVDGCKLEVTSNVLEIIQCRSFYLKARLIWCDAICINQNDPAERSQQVQLMRTIYRKASRVLVWLGSPPDAQAAVSFLVQLHTKMTNYHLDDAELKSILKIGTDSHQWPALLNLLDHPYWRRSWIIQEISVATTVHIYYGGDVINWDILSTVIRGFNREGMGTVFMLTEVTKVPKKFPYQGKAQIHVISDIRQEVQEGSEISLRDMLLRTAHCIATDPRDKIFAVLGIVEKNAQQELIPNYETPVRDVYLSASRFLIRHYDPFDIAHQAGVGYKSRVAGLPSWAIDWSQLGIFTPLWRVPARAPYSASKDTLPNFQFIPHTELISIDGICVDELVELGPDFASNILDEELIEQGILLSKSIQQAINVANKSFPETYLNGQSRTEALWRTLIGDRIDNTRPAPPIYGDYFQAMLRVTGFVAITQSNDNQESVYLDILKKHYPTFINESAEILTAKIEEDSVQSAKISRMTAKGFGGRRFAVTKRGYMALVPPRSELGDLVCILYGAQSPFILRRDSAGKALAGATSDAHPVTYQLVGDAYVHGMMDGEMMDQSSSLETETFVIR